MSFSIFNEAFYRSTNPDVNAAVQAGVFPSGLAHFQAAGLREGRTSVSPFFNETDYRRRYPDVNAVVQSGGLVSGLQHFIASGETEGRPINDYFLESSYRSRNADVDAAVRSGVLPSGFAHYLQNGRLEGRSAGSFNEFYYTRDGERGNPDVYTFIQQDRLFNGFEHYEKAGKFEGRIGRFSGTSGNDRVVATGANTEISGLDSQIVSCGQGGTPTGGQCTDWANLGVAQIDTLVGGEGADTIVAAQFSRGKFFGGPTTFYDRFGNNDYLKIENFDPNRDRLLLGAATADFTAVPFDDRIEIFRLPQSTGISSFTPTTNDLVAVIANPSGQAINLSQIVV